MQIRPFDLISFCSNQKFDDLKHENPKCLTSRFFRFGGGYDEQSRDFAYAVDIIKAAFLLEKKPKILMVGHGENAQELYSYAAVIKDLFPEKPLEDLADFTCVDLQPEFSEEHLKRLGYLDAPSWAKCGSGLFDKHIYGPVVPIYAQSSFDKIPNPQEEGGFLYRTKKEIDKFCQKILKTRTLWDTDIVDFSKDSKQKFDVISMQNVYYYLNDSDKQSVKDNLPKMLKTNRFLVTEGIANYDRKLDYIDDNGIWVKPPRGQKSPINYTTLQRVLNIEQVNKNITSFSERVVGELTRFAVLK